MRADHSCPCRVIGPGTYPPDDPDGSKSRKEFEEMCRGTPFSNELEAKDREESRKMLDELLGRKSLTGQLIGETPLNSEVKAAAPVSEDSFIGLDLSLCSTGFCMKRGNVFTIETIKTEPKNFKNDLDRLIHIRDTILRKIPADVKMICIEDFFSSPHAGSAIKLAGLGIIVRMAIYERGLSLALVAPTSLKKYILGKGVGEKSLVLREVYRKWGVEAADDNAADGCVLAYMAESISMARDGVVQDGLTKPQREVISTLLASSAERCYNFLYYSSSVEKFAIPRRNNDEGGVGSRGAWEAV